MKTQVVAAAELTEVLWKEKQHWQKNLKDYIDKWCRRTLETLWAYIL